MWKLRFYRSIVGTESDVKLVYDRISEDLDGSSFLILTSLLSRFLNLACDAELAETFSVQVNPALLQLSPT